MTLGLPQRLSIGVLLIFGGQCVYYFPKLPETVASHFGAQGKADGWTSKTAFIAIMAGSMLLVTAMSWGIGLLTRVLPEEWINLPNKDYWLGGPQREATLTFIKNYTAWLMLPVQILLVLLCQITFQVNLDGSQKLPPAFIVILILFIVLMMILAFYPLWRFRKGAKHG